MSERDDGGSAFPLPISVDGNPAYKGMSIRDYFAAAIFPAIATEYLRANGHCVGADHPYNNIPVHVYRMADALLKERSK